MSMTLADFLKGASGRPFVWGECDCCLFAADWVLARTGQDPAAGWRGRYDTKARASQIAHRAGGLAHHVAAQFSGLNIAKTDAPDEGDVGVLVLPFHGQIVGIRTSLGRWTFKTQRGVLSAACPNVIAAWSIP